MDLPRSEPPSGLATAVIWLVLLIVPIWIVYSELERRVATAVIAAVVSLWIAGTAARLASSLEVSSGGLEVKGLLRRRFYTWDEIRAGGSSAR
jgi:hypothetical protein